MDLIFVMADITQLIIALIIIILSIVGSIIQSQQEAAKQRRKKPPKQPKEPADEIETLLQSMEESLSKPRDVSPAGRKRPQGRGGERPKVAKPVETAPELVPVAELVGPKSGLPTTFHSGESIAQHVAETFQKSRETLAGSTGIGLEAAAGLVTAVVRESIPPPGPSPSQMESVPQPTPPVVTTPPEVVEAPFHPLSQVLLNTFSTPEGMATAMILRDVIERPEWRWRK